MAAPYSNSERKANSHAELSLRGLRSRVQRANLREIALYTEWMEPGQRSETLAEVSPPWSVLRSVSVETCAHTCGPRTNCLRAWACSAVIVGCFFLRTQESAFDEMAWELAAAPRAGNAGMRPATHTTDAAPRPIFSSRTPRRAQMLECRLQSAGSKSAPSPHAGFAWGEGREGGGWFSLLVKNRITLTEEGCDEF